MSKQYHRYVIEKAALNKAALNKVAKLSRLSVMQAEVDKWASRIILAQELCRPDLEAGAIERHQLSQVEVNRLKSEIDQLNHQIVTAKAVML
jgi:DNA-binding XRE family transcriptional regulator